MPAMVDFIHAIVTSIWNYFRALSPSMIDTSDVYIGLYNGTESSLSQVETSVFFISIVSIIKFVLISFAFTLVERKEYNKVKQEYAN